MKKYKVLVTGIGGNVGQGILRNIRSIDSGIYLVGTNISEFSPGNHLCDKVYKVPYSYDEGFIEQLLSICKAEQIDLIIPSTDYESLYLSEKREMFPTMVTSDYSTNQIFTDKYLTFENFSRHQIPFATSFLPSQYDFRFKEIILKPKQGRGSRGIYLNPTDLSTFTDKDYMVQELAKGVEITTAFYVSKSHQIHGHITMERKLENGTTVLSLVTHEYDHLVIPIMEAMVRNFSIQGSCNIQSIVTSEGKVIPFEINGRISGTNSIRSNFGFEDVRYSLEEYLYHQPLTPVQIQPGAATRILMDVIYPGVKDWKELEQSGNPSYLF